MENPDRASSRRNGAKRHSGIMKLLPSMRSLTRGKTAKLKTTALEQSLEGALALDVSYVSYNAGLAKPGAAPRGLAVSLGAAGPSLRHLDLSQMARLESGGQESFGKALVSSLQRCPSLRTLKLAGNGLRDAGLELLVTALSPSGEATAPSLEELDLSWNRFSNGNLVARLLADCGSRLRSLNLESNEFGDVAVVALCAGLSLNLKVQSLNLARNRFGNDGLVALANALRHQQSYTEEEAAEEVPRTSSATPRPSLARWLVSVQCALEQGGTPHALGTSCLGLRQLDVSGTRVADAGAVALAEAIRAGGGAGSLGALVLQGTAIGSRGRAALEEAARARQGEVEEFAQAAAAAIGGQGPAPEGRMPRLLAIQGLGLEALGAELAARSGSWLESLDAAMTVCPGSPRESACKKPSLAPVEGGSGDDAKTVTSPAACGRFGMADADSEPLFDEPESEASMVAPPEEEEEEEEAPEAPPEAPVEALQEACLTAEALAEAEKQEGEASICRSQTERTEEVEELRARRIVQQQRGRLEEGTFFMSTSSSPEPEQEVDCGASASGTPAGTQLRASSKTRCEHLEDAIRCATGACTQLRLPGLEAATGACPLQRLPGLGFAAEGAGARGEAAEALGARAMPRLTLPGSEDWSDAPPHSWAAAQMLAQEGSTRRQLEALGNRPPPQPLAGGAPPAGVQGQLEAEAAGLAQRLADGGEQAQPAPEPALPSASGPEAPAPAAVGGHAGPEAAPAPAGKAKGKGKGPPPPPPKGAGAAPAPAVAAAGEAAEPAASGAKGKGKGKGKGGPPPPAATQEGATPQGKGGPPAPKGKGKGKGKSGGPSPDAKAAPPRLRAAATVSMTGAGSAPFHRKIYWKPLELQCMEGTIFEEGPFGEGHSTRIDTGALQRMFEGESAKLAAAAAKSSSLLRSVQGKAEGTKLLSDNRARNIAIILKRLPTTTAVLSRILSNLEWENELLRTDQLEQILDAIPTKEEAEQLAPHAAPEALAKLRDVEQMVLPLTEIRRGSARVKLICFARNVSAQAEAAAAPLDSLRAACAAIHSSQTLREVMMSAIEIGNYINTGDSNMGAKAITIGSLLQLRDFKMGRMSSLHFLCAQLRLGRGETAEALQQELRPVIEASKHQIQGISQAVRAFDADANMLATEWKNFAREYEGGQEVKDLIEEEETVESAMLIRGSAKRRLERLAELVDGMSKKLHEDVEMTAAQVKDTLRFCGVRVPRCADVPADFEPFLAQLAEFVRAFRQHWGEVNADLPRYSAFFTGDGLVDPSAEGLRL